LEVHVEKRLINAPDAPTPAGGYAQAVEVSNAARLLFISGQIPVATDGQVPGTFAEQSRLAWQNVEAQLGAAGMTLDHLVKVTIYLADRQYALENRVTRQAVLGDRQIAMTVVIAGIFDAGWLIEIEAIAAA
jgi:enamine deaminase RidA (YjgF/YER057c/UK114 family)